MAKKPKQKYYVVWKGANPGIYTTWADCQSQIAGFPGAKYKSFPTKEEATQMFRNGYEAYQILQSKSSTAKVRSAGNIIQNSISVDAACSGNPGLMEYRGVITTSGQEIFKMGPFQHGTNNVGEFLGIVHGLALLYKKQNSNTAIYTDSKTAMAWIRKGKMNSKLERIQANKPLFELVDKAENWLKTHNFKTEIIKWETKVWGEIPADFGRK